MNRFRPSRRRFRRSFSSTRAVCGAETAIWWTNMHSRWTRKGSCNSLRGVDTGRVATWPGDDGSRHIPGESSVDQGCQPECREGTESVEAGSNGRMPPGANGGGIGSRRTVLISRARGAGKCSG